MSSFSGEEFLKNTVARAVGLFVHPLAAAGSGRGDPASVRDILVVRQHDQLGDMLCSIPLLRAIKHHFPSASLTLVTSPVNHAIMLENPYVDRVVNYRKERLFRSLRSLAACFRQTRFDMAVVPATVSVSLTSNLMALLSGAGTRVGPGSLNGVPNASASCFTLPVELSWDRNPRMHQTRRNLEILRPLGISTDDLTARIGLTETERETARAILAPYRKRFRFLVGFHPGAGKASNRWDPARFASTANRIHKECNAGIIITSGPMDKEPVGRMLARMSCEYLLIERRPIRDVAAILDLLDLYLTNDTGTMHVAGATATDLLALFGPTDPLQWAPVGRNNHFIAAKDSVIDTISESEVLSMASLILEGRERR